MKYGLFFYLLVVHVTCLNIKNEKKCNDFSNLASKYFQKYAYKEMREDLDLSNYYINKALICDPKSPTANLLKIEILFKKKSYDSVLLVLNNFQKYHNGPDIKFIKGEVYERLNMLDSAKVMYIKAKTGYEELLKVEPDNSAFILAYLEVILHVEGKDKAIEKAKEYKKRYPHNEEFQYPEKLINLMKR